MMNKLMIVLVPFLLASSLGCASGPTYEEIEMRIPPVSDGQGRIFFYRTQSFGAGIKPQIRVNGEKVGKSQAKGFFFVDRPPGDYEIACSTEVERAQTLHLEASETRYIKAVVSMGFFLGHVSPKLVAPEEGREGIRGLHYTGSQELLLPES